MNQQNLYGHPKGLFVLFFTEMWERFSFYGMRALLVLYMTQQLIPNALNPNGTVWGFAILQTSLESMFGHLSTQAIASHIYGLYTGLIYFTPIFGGIMADRYWGQRKTVVIGAVIMAVGHFLMAFQSLFLPALMLLILGSGCFKPNISTQVGSLYAEDDPRRDSAFTIFYMGINLGAFFSPLICGSLGQIYGWHVGFAAAGIGMLIGLLVYLSGQKYLSNDIGMLSFTDKTVSCLNGRDWQVIAGLTTLAILNILFWAVYEQQGNTLQLFAEQRTDRHFMGWEMPSTWFQSLNPAFIFILAPLLAKVDSHVSMQNFQLSSIAKMALGAALLGTAFLVLMYAAIGIENTGKINFMWLVMCTFIYTLGELYLSPIGLSLVSKVSPPKLMSMLMGMWFLSSFFGNILSGYIGSFYEIISNENYFMMLAILAFMSSTGIFALKTMLNKAVREHRE